MPRRAEDLAPLWLADRTVPLAQQVAELRVCNLRNSCVGQHDHSSLGNSVEGVQANSVTYLCAGLPIRYGSKAGGRL